MLTQLEKMDSQINKLTDLIKDLLDLTRIQTGKLSFHLDTFDIRELVSDTVDTMKTLDKDHSIVLRDSRSIPVYADKDRIGQVLVNFMTNASKYSPVGSQITVSVEKKNGKAVVSVEDRGIGIAKEHQKKIFDRFYQVTLPKEKTYPGLGIGLYISSEVIKRHNGEIWVESTKGKGSTFSFSLPIDLKAIAKSKTL